MKPFFEHIPVKEEVQDQEMSRLMTAAVVNPNFCRLLLDNPSTALSMGYNGERFAFNAEVQSKISAIQADSLQEFATKMIAVRQNGKDHAPIGRVNQKALQAVFQPKPAYQTKMVVTAGD